MVTVVDRMFNSGMVMVTYTGFVIYGIIMVFTALCMVLVMGGMFTRGMVWVLYVWLSVTLSSRMNSRLINIVGRRSILLRSCGV